MKIIDVSIDTIVALAKQKQTKWCSVPKSINCEAGKEAFHLRQYILYVYVYEFSLGSTMIDELGCDNPIKNPDCARTATCGITKTTETTRFHFLGNTIACCQKFSASRKSAYEIRVLSLTQAYGLPLLRCDR